MNLNRLEAYSELVAAGKTRTCDYIVLGVNTNKTHLIELKGANIEEAFLQIGKTIEFLLRDSEVSCLVEEKERMDAYIVSPGRQKIPDIHSQAEKDLAKKLVRGSKVKPRDMYELIRFVKVVPSQKKLSEKGRQILSSGKAPVELD